MGFDFSLSDIFYSLREAAAPFGVVFLVFLALTYWKPDLFNRILEKKAFILVLFLAVFLTYLLTPASS